MSWSTSFYGSKAEVQSRCKREVGINQTFPYDAASAVLAAIDLLPESFNGTVSTYGHADYDVSGRAVIRSFNTSFSF